MPRQLRIEHPDNQLNLPHKFIALTQEQYAKVDTELFDYLSQWLWFANARRGDFYAGRWVPGGGLLFLHNTVWQHLNGAIPEGYTVDHRNREGLDNTIENLRLATPTQQSWNRSRREDNTSGFVGVCRNCGKWQAHVKLGGKKTHLGSFEDRTDAAKARDLVAWVEHGDFAQLNFPGMFGGGGR